MVSWKKKKGPFPSSFVLLSPFSQAYLEDRIKWQNSALFIAKAKQLYKTNQSAWEPPKLLPTDGWS